MSELARAVIVVFGIVVVGFGVLVLLGVVLCAAASRAFDDDAGGR